MKDQKAATEMIQAAVKAARENMKSLGLDELRQA